MEAARMIMEKLRRRKQMDRAAKRTDILTSLGVIIVLFNTSIFRIVSFIAQYNYPRGLPRSFNINTCVRVHAEREIEIDREIGDGRRHM